MSSLGPANESTVAHFGPNAHPISDGGAMQASRQNTGPQLALIVVSARQPARENQYAIGGSARSGLRHNQLAKNVAE